MNNEVLEKLEVLRGYSNTNRQLFKRMMEAYGGALYPLDFLAVAALNRSEALFSGFCQMIEAKNLLCAAPFIRLQLDNCLRFYAAFIVSDPHEFAHEILNGKSARQLTDKEGKRMTDAYLVEKLSTECPWVKDVYRETSGFIHLSDKHIFQTLRQGKDGIMTMSVSATDIRVKDKTYIEALLVFRNASKLLFQYINNWILTKANPEILDDLKKNTAGVGQ
jgi:hypothetical protein